jgi:Mn-dependent DtxR family transcriptional regulator
MISFLKLIAEQDSLISKPKGKRRDKRSLPASDRSERKRHHKQPLFMRRCVVRLVDGPKKFDSGAAFAICTSTMKKAGYFRKGKDGKLVLTAKGKRREREYFDQEDTPTQLDRFDQLMKQGRVDRALKKSFESASYLNLSRLISIIESNQNVVFVDEAGEDLGFSSVPEDIMIRSLARLGLSLDKNQGNQIVITNSDFKKLEKALKL